MSNKWSFFIYPFTLKLKEQATDSISVLEGALQLKKDFYVHTLRTLDLLASDAAANGETESSTAGLRISADELHCQVSGRPGVWPPREQKSFITYGTMHVIGSSWWRPWRKMNHTFIVETNKTNPKLFSCCFRCIMIWEVFSSSKAALTSRPTRRPGITSDAPRNCWLR